MRKFLMFFTMLLSALLLSNCGGGGGSSNNSAAPEEDIISLGTLPNGSKVMVDNKYLPISAGQSTSFTLKLKDGQSGGKFSVGFDVSQATNLQQTKILSTLSIPGVTITPTSCNIGVDVFGLTNTCTVQISVDSLTATGKYSITPVFKSADGTITRLAPLSLMVSGKETPSSNNLEAFYLTDQNHVTRMGVIVNNDIAVTMPYGTDVSKLVATYVANGVGVTVSGVTQRNGITVNDFSAPLTYVVTADNGSTRSYHVQVIVDSNDDKQMLSFAIDNNPGVISGNYIEVNVPYGKYDVSHMIARFSYLGEKVTVGNVEQHSDMTTNDFSSPVQYTVHAADGSTMVYHVVVQEGKADSKEIKSFGFNGLATNTVITYGEINKIAVEVPFGTDISNLTAIFSTTGSKVTIGDVEQYSDLTTNDFSKSLTYTVTAADKTTQNYVVEVTIAKNSAKVLNSFRIDNYYGVQTENPYEFLVTLPYGSSLKDRVAHFSTTGAQVTIGDVVQISGLTNNDFTQPLTYTVHAANGSTQDYNVIVINAKNDAKSLTSFQLGSQNALINEESHSVNITLPYGTNTSDLIAKFTTNGAASVKVNGVLQTSGETTNDFSKAIKYTVFAEDGTFNEYTINLTIAPNTAKDITSFSLLGEEGVINGTDINLTFESGTPVDNLIAKFNTTGVSLTVASKSQTSELTSNDFSKPVTYTVHAADGSTKNYVIKVSFYPSRMNIMMGGDNGGIYKLDANNKLTNVVLPQEFLRSVLYDEKNKKFIAVGNSGFMVSSADGIKWQEEISNESVHFGKIVANKSFNKYLISTYTYKILVSTDGINWTSKNFPTTTSTRGAIITSNGTMIVGARDGYIYRSVDNGDNWSRIQITAKSGHDITSFAIGSNRNIVAVGKSGLIAVSRDDGATWTLKYDANNSLVAPSLTDKSFNSITFNSYHNEMMAVGGQGIFATSSDNGETWQLKTSDVLSVELNDVISDDFVYVAVGLNGAIYNSLDGLTWTARESRTNLALYSLAASSNLYIAVGNKGVILNKANTNLQDPWNFSNNPSSSSGDNITSMYMSTSGMYVATTDNNTSPYEGKILASTNGESWSVQFKDAQALYAVTANLKSNMFVAVGTYGYKVYNSTNGINWMANDSGLQSGYIRGITYYGGKFVMVNDAGSIASSSDGLKWVKLNSGITTQLSAITVSKKGKFIVVGNNGLILNSNDGINWNIAHSGVNNYLTAVAVNKSGKFVAVGQNGLILTSADGIIWSQKTSGINSTLSGISVTTSGKFVAVGDGGTVLTSLDGDNWSKLPLMNGIKLNSAVATY